MLRIWTMGHWGQATLSPRRWGQTTLRADDFEGKIILKKSSKSNLAKLSKFSNIGYMMPTLQCVHLKGFSPLWVRMWLSSACFCVVEKSHCVHLCGLSPVCVSLWFSIDVHLEVAKLHCLMSALEWLFSKVRGNMIFQVLLSFCWVVALCALVWFFVSMFKDLSSKCLLRWSEMCAL